MKKFNHFITEQELMQNTAEDLMEKLITFGGKAYPKFGNIVIMAGGAGSGKGFVLNKLVGVEGKVFDVDELKRLASKTPAIKKRVKKELGVDIEALGKDLKNPDNVSKLHDIIANFLGADKGKERMFYRTVLTAPADRKPNIIFDMTFKEITKLEKVANDASKLGYDKKNVHIVWVVNDIEVAQAQNAKRARRVPSEILINTHRGAANTMGDIINMGTKLKKYMDGDIVFAFNKVGVDANLATSGKGGSYIKDANYFYVKKQGKAPTSIDKLDKDIRRKIKGYVPKNVEWD
ncbi:hypothetical protein OAS42_00300 [bacterium]|nr:hypothetical protein [bacterium]